MKSAKNAVGLKKRGIFWCLLILFGLSLIPILALSGYSYPCADDFSASDTAYFAWRDTGSILQVIKAAAENVRYNYHEWSGVFASVFWTSLQPGIFGEGYYGITTWITIFLLLIACGYFFKTLLGKYLGADFYDTGIITVAYLFSLIQCMPSGLEGLYWHAGVVNYTWAFGFLMLLTALLLSNYREEAKKKVIIKTVAACILAVLTGGGNYITALQGCLWLTLLFGCFGINEFKIKKKTIKQFMEGQVRLLLPYGLLLFSFAVSVLAPGNKVRMGSSTGLGAFKSVIVSFYYALEEPIENWLSWPILMLLLLAVPSMVSIARESRCRLSDLMMVAGGILGFGLVAAGFTPNLYAQGAMEAGRLHNTVFFIWLVILYLEAFMVIIWLMGKFNVSPSKESSILEVKILGVLFTGFAALSVVTGVIDVKTYIGLEAAEVITSGQAENYRRENEARIKQLSDPAAEEIMLQRFTNPPSLLLFQDLSPDPNEWVNTVVAEYYGKKSVSAW